MTPTGPQRILQPDEPDPRRLWYVLQIVAIVGGLGLAARLLLWCL